MDVQKILCCCLSQYAIVQSWSVPVNFVSGYIVCDIYSEYLFNYLFSINLSSKSSQRAQYQWWYYLPRLQDRGALFTVPSGLYATLITSPPSLRLILSDSFSFLTSFRPSVSEYIFPSYSYTPVSSTISTAACAPLFLKISIAG